MMQRIIISVFLLTCFTSCYDEMEYAPAPENYTSLLSLNGKPIAYDSEQSFMLCKVDAFGAYKAMVNYDQRSSVFINGEYISNSDSCDFGIINKSSESIIEIIDPSGKTNTYKLFFTTLPVVKLSYNYKKILDEPKGSSLFALDSSNTSHFINCCGIETRGGTANRRPKKSFGIEFWNNYEQRESRTFNFFEMSPNDDWILDALYSDRSRVRNRVAFDIWNRIRRSAKEHNNTVCYSDIKGEYVELFLNQKYQGLYCLTERIEGEKLGLTSKQDSLQGFLYKSEGWTTTNQLIEVKDTTVDYQNKWQSWEQKYPNNKHQLIWKPLYNFVDFMANSSDQQFSNQINEVLNLDNVIDYYILINLIYGTDNVGKNYMLAKKSINSPFCLIPWDMDATWGRNYKGEKIKYDKEVHFIIFERLIKLNPSDFKQRLHDRYFDLRETILTNDAIMDIFQYYTDELINSGAHERNDALWPEQSSNLQHELEYIETWLSKHTEFLDSHVESFK